MAVYIVKSYQLVVSLKAYSQFLIPFRRKTINIYQALKHLRSWLVRSAPEKKHIGKNHVTHSYVAWVCQTLILSVVSGKIKGSFLYGLSPTNWLVVLKGIISSYAPHFQGLPELATTRGIYYISLVV